MHIIPYYLIGIKLETTAIKWFVMDRYEGQNSLRTGQMLTFIPCFIDELEIQAQTRVMGFRTEFLIGAERKQPEYEHMPRLR